MSKHTPGPWMQGRINPENVSAGGSLVCRAFPRAAWGGEQYANARLISASPDLLEFAEEVRRTGDTRLASMAIATIAKATGGEA